MLIAAFQVSSVPINEHLARIRCANTSSVRDSSESDFNRSKRSNGILCANCWKKQGFCWSAFAMLMFVLWPKNQKMTVDYFSLLATWKFKLHVGIAFTYSIKVCSAPDSIWYPVVSIYENMKIWKPVTAQASFGRLWMKLPVYVRNQILIGLKT
jgi:hypothetical protein